MSRSHPTVSLFLLVNLPLLRLKLDLHSTSVLNLRHLVQISKIGRCHLHYSHLHRDIPFLHYNHTQISLPVDSRGRLPASVDLPAVVAALRAGGG